MNGDVINHLVSYTSHLDGLGRDQQADCKEYTHFCMEAEQNTHSLNWMQLMQVRRLFICVDSLSAFVLSYT